MSDQYVCSDCIKGRHAICPGMTPQTASDVARRCQCPVCHANLYVLRKPVLDSAAGRYVDPEPSLEMFSTLRMYDRDRRPIWQADGQHGEVASWAPDPLGPMDGVRHAIEWRHRLGLSADQVPFSLGVYLTAVER